MSWQVEFHAGVWLPQIGWWLDAHFPQARSFVSHAHSDHVAPHGEILCSTGTSRLLRARVPGNRIEHVLPFEHGEQLTADCAVTLLPAGHIFGSAQSLLAHDVHGTLLYTGDFKLRQGRSAEACQAAAADVLVMETTFGRPQYVFPPTAQVLNDITAFCHACIDDGETPVLFGYSLGKSQELLCGLAEARLPVMLHPQPLRLTQIYEELGMRFPAYRAFNAAEVRGHVVICPPQQDNAAFLRQIGPRRTAVVTGWAMDPGATYRYQCDAAFPLSDHADFPDLLKYVELVRPKRVLTLHGFAQDFARTLRERGVEAWAIGEDNQLEFGLSGTSRVEVRGGDDPAAAPVAEGKQAVPVAAEIPPPLREDSANAVCSVANVPNGFARFALVAGQVRATPRKLEKIEILRAYLAELAPDDAATASLFFTARPFPQSDGRVLTLGWSVIKRAVLEVAQMTEADYRAAYHRFADAGDAAEALLAGKTRSASATLAEIGTFFADVAAARGPTAKLDLLAGRLATLAAAEAKFLVKIITGDLRIGLKEGLVEEAIAAATAQPIEAVREANMLSGDIAGVVRAARMGQLEEIQLRVFHPVQFMLASPEPTAESIVARLSPPVWLEEKYDGIRCQVHKDGARVELYSRDLKCITNQFPDVAHAAGALPGSFVIDGELLAWRDDRALPFAELQKRLGRKGDDFFLGAEIPVSVSCYDLLYRDGQSLLKRPLAERRQELESLVGSSGPFLLAPVTRAMTAADIEVAFMAARRRGNEGLMAKDPASPYTPGRRGLAWLKLKKAYATLDVVVVGVEYGHGKRRDVLSDYTFAVRDSASDRLLTVGKAYSGLTDAEIAALTEHFLANTIEVHGRYRTVVPDTVIEVAFDTIQPSARHQSGFALRFPRIARIRTDKTPGEIDTVETCRKLAQAAQSR
ncbi:MAG TPA: ATP-dependent DNA ligase [Opitutaceae bacterium]|nr:ATP-dependent DNA ligase [Opitutaceae bacterium]